MSVVHAQTQESIAYSLLDHLKSDREFLAAVIMAEDIKKSLASAGYILPEAFYVRLETAIRRIREGISDQLHVFELKVGQVIANFANSGNGGYW